MPFGFIQDPVPPNLLSGDWNEERLSVSPDILSKLRASGWKPRLGNQSYNVFELNYSFPKYLLMTHNNSLTELGGSEGDTTEV